MASRSGSMGDSKKLNEKEKVEEEPEAESTDAEKDLSEETQAEPTDVDQAPDEQEEVDGPDPDEGVSLESLDPKSELWEGGPLVGTLQEWKSQYGEIYLTYFTPTVRVVWRPLSRSDYRKIVARMSEIASEQDLSNVEVNMIQEELVAQTVMLWPDYDVSDDSNELGGLASTISQHAMEASGFSAMEVRQL